VDDELLQDFLIESTELIDRLDQDFVELESNPTSRELLAAIFRAMHTIKGTAGFLAFDNLERLTHAGENLLSLLRDGELTLNVEMTDSLLAVVDATRSMLESVSETGTDGDETWTELIDRLHQLANGDQSDSGNSVDAAAPAEPESVATETDADEDDTEHEAAAPAEAGTTEVRDDDTDPSRASEVSADSAPEPVLDTPEPVAASEPVDAPEVIDAPEPVDAPVSPDVPAAVDETEPEPVDKAESTTTTKPTDSTIRVDVELLDRLMNLTGELVLARNQVLQFHALSGDPVFHNTAQQLDLITTEMQEGVMQTRMQAIGNVWAKFPRIVRDLAASLDKDIELVMTGKETELDKTLVEAIKDPLTHIVRNSVDHGIEPPAERIAAGKPAQGRLELRAFHEGGQVIIEITDDGRGLNVEKIKAAAVRKGVISPERAETLSDRAAADLIFAPGFSTAEKVTNVSGRGVGMDVVRTNVEKIGGSVDISTELGMGTTLTVKIPLTLAIIPALIITCDDDYYMIPQINLVEVLHIEPDAEPGIESVGDAEVFRLRDSLLPIVHLREVLGLDTACDFHETEGTSIVVLNADGRLFGLVVDRINDTEEIVVKPLAPNLKHLLPFGGTTIMGDGTVSLILDAIGIGQSSGISTGEEEVDELEEERDPGERRHGPTTVLVSRIGESRVAIPVSLIARLEEIEPSLIERAGGRDLVQYRGRLLTIFNLGEVLGYAHDELDPERPMSVLVHERDDSIYGLVVDEILDVHDVDLPLNGEVPMTGVGPSVVIGNRATDTIDLASLLEIVNRRTALQVT